MLQRYLLEQYPINGDLFTGHFTPLEDLPLAGIIPSPYLPTMFGQDLNDQAVYAET